MITFLKGAILTMALFFISTVFALEQKSKLTAIGAKVETYKDLISKAQVLLLQKDRAQSINILLMGLEKEDPKSIAHQELLKKLTKVSHMFLGESAQSVYELAITLDKNNKKIAIDKLNEALSIEPQNLQIIKALLGRYLSENNCSKTIKLLESYRQINPYDSELPIYDVHLAVCQKDQAKYSELKKINDSNSQIPSEFWLLSDLRFKIANGGDSQIIGSGIKSHYPEILYLKWKLEDVTGPERTVLGDEYLQVCKSWKYSYTGTNFPDPWVCSNIKEVEETKEKK